MLEYTLDGSYLRNPQEAHEYLMEQLELPEYYGHNLDALYDCLTEMGEAEITIWNADRENPFTERLLQVFEDATEDNDELAIIIIEDEKADDWNWVLEDQDSEMEEY